MDEERLKEVERDARIAIDAGENYISYHDALKLVAEVRRLRRSLEEVFDDWVQAEESILMDRGVGNEFEKWEADKAQARWRYLGG